LSIGGTHETTEYQTYGDDVLGPNKPKGKKAAERYGQGQLEASLNTKEGCTVEKHHITTPTHKTWNGHIQWPGIQGASQALRHMQQTSSFRLRAAWRYKAPISGAPLRVSMARRGERRPRAMLRLLEAAESEWFRAGTRGNRHWISVLISQPLRREVEWKQLVSWVDAFWCCCPAARDGR
jgi:hypothetical protein